MFCIGMIDPRHRVPSGVSVGDQAPFVACRRRIVADRCRDSARRCSSMPVNAFRNLAELVIIVTARQFSTGLISRHWHDRFNQAGPSINEVGGGRQRALRGRRNQCARHVPFRSGENELP